MTPIPATKIYKTAPFFRAVTSAFNLDLNEMLTEANLPKDFLDDGVHMIDRALFTKIWDVLFPRLPQSDMIITMLDALPDVDAYPMISPAKFVADGMQAMSHFAIFASEYMSGVSLTNSDRDQFTLSYNSSANNPAMYKINFNRLLVLLRLMRVFTGKHIVPKAATVSFDPAEEPSLAEFLGMTPSFGAVNSLSISIEDAKLPFSSADEEMYHIVCRELSRRLIADDNPADVVAKIEGILTQSIATTHPNVHFIAAQFGISRRSLQRQLTALGTSFSEVLDRYRRASVEQLIEENKLSKGEIAYQIGFKDTNSLYRAQAKWRKQT